VAEHHLSLAVNGREYQLHSKLVPFRSPEPADGSLNGHGPALGPVAVVGLGYVGLPTAVALHGRCTRVLGLDVSAARLAEIAAGEADLGGPDRLRLEAALSDESLELTSDPSVLAEADAVIVCVPTPVDEGRAPDLRALRGACETVVAQARPGQVIILTSTTFAGTTRELIAAPLAERGLQVGTDVFVAFSPERIDPGNPDHVQRDTPRVVGGITPECATRGGAVIEALTDVVYLVSSPEAAEAAKLYENIFRAVTLALANEFADACGVLGLDPVEVTLAAGTKPYGFLAALPGPGVGGHCIPCDPHYLLWQLGRSGHHSPLIEQAMLAIEGRPAQVARRAGELLAADGGPGGLAGASVLVVGVSYKAGVRDLRESPALGLLAELATAGAKASYFDPLIPEVALADGSRLASVEEPSGSEWDLVIVHTLHPGVDYSWVTGSPRVLDATFQFDAAPHRAVV
jgi:nucleotide sugar dehydrogenase